MDSQSRPRNNKRAILYAIGAGTLLLALMAFSALCFGVIHVCHRWLAMAVLSFWEILGVSITSFFGFILIRSIYRRRSSMADNSISRRLRESVECRSGSWRELYDQLSEEERLEMKEVMRKYCSGEQGCGEQKRNAGDVDSASQHIS